MKLFDFPLFLLLAFVGVKRVHGSMESVSSPGNHPPTVHPFFRFDYNGCACTTARFNLTTMVVGVLWYLTHLHVKMTTAVKNMTIFGCVAQKYPCS